MPATRRSRCSPPAASSPTPEPLRAAELALMFHIYFLAPRRQGPAVRTSPRPFLSTRWLPVDHRLHGAGLSHPPRRRPSVRSLGGGNRVATDRRALPRHVVPRPGHRGAAPCRGRPDRLGDAPWRERIARLRNAPPFLVTRLWLDRPVAPGRPGFLGTGGFPTPTTSVCWSAGQDEAAHWAARTGGPCREPHAHA
ncbi:hypothetical protein LT493_41630 [Streptomyces tricolor]|nr:hypothetical protein [Streptomyces tricolor]